MQIANTQQLEASTFQLAPGLLGLSLCRALGLHLIIAIMINTVNARRG